jgi:hypothetical protein
MIPPNAMTGWCDTGLTEASLQGMPSPDRVNTP